MTVFQQTELEHIKKNPSKYISVKAKVNFGIALTLSPLCDFSCIYASSPGFLSVKCEAYFQGGYSNT